MDQERTFWRRHRWLLWTGGIAFAGLAAIITTLAIMAHRIEPYVRARIIDGLSQHFHTHVELDTFHLSIGNGFRGEWGVWAQGRGLRIWPPLPEGASLAERPAGEPLVSLAQFAFHAPLRYDPGAPIDINDVRLKGLALRMPPKSRRVELNKPGNSSPSSIKVHIARVECANADLLIETDKPGKLPREFAIPILTLTDLNLDSPVHFDATLTNPIPAGAIHSVGTFGPWRVADPAESPIQGDFTFNNADLGTIKGIAGILNSSGRYTGTLRNITVDGVTDTPDFRLTTSDKTLPLRTSYHALVDGTDGDTYLEPVDAMLGSSHIIARGQVVRVLAAVGDDGKPHSIGHDISLSIEIDKSRIEDFLRITTTGPTPILTGNLTLKTQLHIPPGAIPVIQKISLTDGTFSLTQSQFTSDKVQGRVLELSLRGQGKPGDVKSTPADSVQADMRGNFKLGDGSLTLSQMQFVVPGADIRVQGTYGIDSGALDFQGAARLDATVSKVVGGWKGFLLTPVDPIFKKSGAGTFVPIHVRGTRKNPDIGIDFNRINSTSPQRPGTS
ncbi:MAG: AsmA-like C-terminal region-containing protein [Terracidiphilus sp.]